MLSNDALELLIRHLRRLLKGFRIFLGQCAGVGVVFEKIFTEFAVRGPQILDAGSQSLGWSRLNFPLLVPENPQPRPLQVNIDVCVRALVLLLHELDK